MTDTVDPALTELMELCAFLLDNCARIPAHRRRQAVLALERAERLVPLRDDEADAVEDQR
jgi:hypothetical protein